MEKRIGMFATGIRNCVGLAVHPSSGDLYCSKNERDGLGDDLVPDYITRVREGAFYGWPWFYIGDNEDPRHIAERADLTGKVTIPDILIQAHSASLGMAFYNGKCFHLNMEVMDSRLNMDRGTDPNARATKSSESE